MLDKGGGGGGGTPFVALLPNRPIGIGGGGGGPPTFVDADDW